MAFYAGRYKARQGSSKARGQAGRQMSRHRWEGKARGQGKAGGGKVVARAGMAGGVCGVQAGGAGKAPNGRQGCRHGAGHYHRGILRSSQQVGGGR